MLMIRTVFIPANRYLHRDGQWGTRKGAAKFTSISAAEHFCANLGIAFFDIIDEDEYDEDDYDYVDK